MVHLFLIGIGAGLTAALLFATLATGQAYAVGLFYLTPLPILLAGIGWNHLAGAIAAITAALVLGAVLGAWYLLAFSVGIGVPAYVLAYLALLARPLSDPARPREGGDPGPGSLDSRFRGNERSGSPTLEWYPVGRIVVAGALLAGTATALSVPAFGTDAESYRAALKEAFERVLRTQTDTAEGEPLTFPGVQDTGRFLDLLTIVMPPAAAVLSMITMLGNLWLAGRISLLSGRLTRPWPSLNELRFPPRAPLLLAAALAGTFLPGIFAVIATFFAATLMMAYAVLGFAIVHGASRALPARVVLLTALWLAVFLIGWPILLVMLIGLADSFIDLRARFAGGTNLPDNRNPNE